MYKKAGIIVGGLIIIIAVVIFIIASNVNKNKDKPDDIPTTSKTAQVQSQDVPTASKKPVTPSQPPVVAPPTEHTPVSSSSVVQSQPVQSQPETPTQPTGSVLVTIDGSTLPAFADVSDIGTVVGRNIYSYNHQVIYSLVINTTTNGQIEWFTTLTNYNIADGTRLECQIRVFNASSGAFPSVISVKKV